MNKCKVLNRKVSRKKQIPCNSKSSNSCCWSSNYLKNTISSTKRQIYAEPTKTNPSFLFVCNSTFSVVFSLFICPFSIRRLEHLALSVVLAIYFDFHASIYFISNMLLECDEICSIIKLPPPPKKRRKKAVFDAIPFISTIKKSFPILCPVFFSLLFNFNSLELVICFAFISNTDFSNTILKYPPYTLESEQKPKKKPHTQNNYHHHWSSSST